MIISINLLDLIIIIGSLLSFCLGIFLMRRGKKSHTYLALFLCGLSIQLFLSSQVGLNLLRAYPYVVILIDSIPYVLSISLYFYVYFSFYTDYEPPISLLIHCLVPLVNSLVFVMLALTWGRAEFSEVVNQVLQGKPPLFMIVITFGKVAHGLIYGLLLVLLVRRFKSDLKLWMKDPTRRQWLIILTISFVFIWISILTLAVLTNLLKLPISTTVTSAIQVFLFMVFILTITLFSLKYPQVLSRSQVREKIKQQLRLTSRDVKVIKKDVDLLVERDKLYLNPDMNLTQLAKLSGLHSNQLSFVINESSMNNFSAYINDFRIMKFKDLSKHWDPKVDTILGLALDSGFKSKSSFNRVFKEKEGVTPSEFMKKSRSHIS